jgi:uncharacterized protein
MEPNASSGTFSIEGCTAIVTGASSGLGAEFARQLAGSAKCILLAARSQEGMEKVAAELIRMEPTLRVIISPCDLATDAGRTALWAKIDAEKLSPDLLINNAGLGDYGTFVDADEKRIRQQIDLNITALTLLAHDYALRQKATPAAARKPIALINLSSLASTMPIPDLAVYAATKAYVSSLSEALAIELEEYRVRVLAVCPGPSPTNFGSTAQRSDGPVPDPHERGLIVVTPTRVVSTSLHALQAGKVRHFPGRRVSAVAWMFEKMPRPLLRVLLKIRYKKARRAAAAGR